MYIFVVIVTKYITISYSKKEPIKPKKYDNDRDLDSIIISNSHYRGKHLHPLKPFADEREREKKSLIRSFNKSNHSICNFFMK